MCTPSVLLAGAFAYAASALSLPQGPESQSGTLPTTTSGIRSSGLQLHDGQLWGIGPRYKVHFDANGVEYTPALGTRAPRNFPLGYTFVSASRGAAAMDATPPIRSHDQDAKVVRYARGTIVETYDLLVEGVEQSFTFEKLPAGLGDLVVRGRITTDLTPRVTAAGLAFELQGIGGVTIEKVVGIDANGARTMGSMRLDGDVLELRLPARFVDTAALPLVLDPLLGTAFVVESTTADEGLDPDVAYDATNDVYCVVWEEVFSASDTDIRGRFVSGAGTPQGSEASVTIATTNDRDPAVGNNNLRNVFLIAWETDADATPGFDIYGRTWNAGSGSFAAITPIRVESGEEGDPDVGGDPGGFEDDVIVVWDDFTEDDIEAVEVQIAADGTFTTFTAQNIDPAGTTGVSGPAISTNCGVAGNHLIVWMQVGSQTDVMGAIWTRNLTTVDASVPIANSTDDEDFPAVDGDGLNWCVAYEKETTAGSNDDDVAVRFVYLDGSTGVRGAEQTVAGANGLNDDEQSASVAWCGGSVLIGHSDRISPTGDYDVYVASVDPFDSGACEGRFFLNLSGSTGSDTFTAVASTFSGAADPSADEAMIVWQNVDASNLGDVVGQLFACEDGHIVDLGGGCSGGGTAYASCARQPNSSFAHRLRDAGSSTSAWLVLSFDRFDGACGSCTLVPDPFTGFVLGTTTNSRGDTSITMGIPADTGLEGFTFYDQWLVMDAAPGCSALGTDLSNAIRVTIE